MIETGFKSQSRVIWGVLASAVLHAVAVVLLALGPGKGTARASTRGPESVTAVLVRKGKTRAKHLLPRLHRVRAAVRKKTRVVARKKHRTRRRKKRESLDAIIARMRQQHGVVKRESKDQRGDVSSTREGVSWGSKHGTVTDPALARAGSRYGAIIRHKIESSLVVPSIITQRQFAYLRTKIKIILTIDRSGILRSAKVSAKSGNAMFDSAVLAAVRRASPFPAPDNAVWQQVKDGIEIVWE